MADNPGPSPLHNTYRDWHLELSPEQLRGLELLPPHLLAGIHHATVTVLGPLFPVERDKGEKGR